jgi:hypothetical protein
LSRALFCRPPAHLLLLLLLQFRTQPHLGCCLAAATAAASAIFMHLCTNSATPCGPKTFLQILPLREPQFHRRLLKTKQPNQAMCTSSAYNACCSSSSSSSGSDSGSGSSTSPIDRGGRWQLLLYYIAVLVGRHFVLSSAHLLMPNRERDREKSSLCVTRHSM